MKTRQIVLKAALSILFLILVLPLQAHSTTWTFSNSDPITIGTNPSATPYPSSTIVTGVTGTVNKVRVTLNGINHSYPWDIGVLLVGPLGQKIVLMDNTGEGIPIVTTTLVFDDSGIPLSTAAIVSGTYQPTNLNGTDFPPPAPVGPYAVSLSTFNTIDPNGTWQLYVRDSFPIADTGSISGGWQIEIFASPPAPSFAVTGTPDNTLAGSPFPVTVTAKNADNTTNTGYTGTIYFSSSAASATLPAPYTFVPADNGSHTFSTVTLNTSGSQTITVSDSGMTGYWNLDEGTGTTADDASGNLNTATLNGPPTWSTEVPGTVFSNTASLSFSGSTNSVSIPKIPALQRTTSTTAAWTKADTDVSMSRVVLSDETTSAGYTCFLENTTGMFDCEFNGGVVGFTSGVAINDNAWHHVALVIDNAASNATIYVDGVARAATSVTLTPSSDPLLLGQFALMPGSYPFIGLLDDVRIYNRALTAAEIVTLAAGGGPVSVVKGTSAAIAVASPAAITVQPQNMTIVSGQAATLSVTATGDGTLSYQWYQGFSGVTTVPIPGATTNSYTTPPLTNPARYWVRVTGTYGAPADSTTAQVITIISKGTSINASAITINDNAAATPYPSTITVSGVTGTISNVRVTLNGLNHTWPGDIGVLLVGPLGQKVVLMENAGGGTDLVNTNLVFDDAGSPLTSAAIVSGTYRPTNLATGRVFPGPAPAGPYDTSLAVFNDIDPNGLWQLFVRDAAGTDIGSISGGWGIEFFSSVQVTSFAVTGTPATTFAGAPFAVTVTAKNADNSTNTGYTGTIYFSSSAASATLPAPYTFVPADNGSHTFSTVTLNTSGSQTITVSDSGMTGYWKLDEGTGTTAADASGNLNTATLNGPPTWSTEVPGTAFSNIASLSFSGSTNSVSIPKIPALQRTTSTTAAWVKADTDATTYRVVLSDETPGAGYSCYLEADTGIFDCQFNGGYGYVTSGVAINDNAWHHVALVIDNAASNATIYVDGVATATISVTLTPSAAPILLGQFAPEPGLFPFLGLLDDVRIYSRALAEEELLTLASGGGLPEVSSTGAAITVVVPATITSQPQNMTIISGQTATLSVTAIGDGLSYQWYQGVSGVTTSPIPDATTNSFTTPPLNGPSSYWVRVTGTYGAPADSTTAQVITIISKGTFINASAITINDNAAATPYPSTITVSGVTGTISNVRVTLNGLTHTWPGDIGVLLVGPLGQKVVLMDSTGGGTDIVNTNLVFDDAGSPLTSAAIVSGTYRPTNLASGSVFPGPAPAGPYDTSLAVFNGIDPNGLWQLFVRDAAGSDIGSISGGWGIEFQTTTHALTIYVDGTGHGSVTYQEIPVVVNTSYETAVATGDQVTLAPLTDQFSLFTGWSGVSACSSGTCQFNMNENTTATATFNLDNAHSVFVDPEYHATIAAAYGAGTTSNGEKIKLWGIDFNEVLMFNIRKEVTLDGGYNSSYSTQNPGDVSTINGSITIRSGKVSVNRIMIKKPE